MGLFGKKKKATRNAEPQPVAADSFEFEVAGFCYHKDSIYDILTLNPDYKTPKSNEKPVYKYKYFEKQCDLIPEPTNKHDPDAIKVCYNGVMLGYVPADQTVLVRAYLKVGFIPKLHIVAGHKKVYEEDEWVTYKKEPYARVRMSK